MSKHCWPWQHDWELRSTMPYRDKSWSDVGVMMTTVLYVCKRCGKVRTKEIHGTWLKEDLENHAPAE